MSGTQDSMAQPHLLSELEQGQNLQSGEHCVAEGTDTAPSEPSTCASGSLNLKSEDAHEPAQANECVEDKTKSLGKKGKKQLKKSQLPEMKKPKESTSTADSFSILRTSLPVGPSGTEDTQDSMAQPHSLSELEQGQSLQSGDHCVDEGTGTAPSEPSTCASGSLNLKSEDAHAPAQANECVEDKTKSLGKKGKKQLKKESQLPEMKKPKESTSTADSFSILRTSLPVGPSGTDGTQDSMVQPHSLSELEQGQSLQSGEYCFVKGTDTAPSEPFTCASGSLNLKSEDAHEPAQVNECVEDKTKSLSKKEKKQLKKERQLLEMKEQKESARDADSCSSYSTPLPVVASGIEVSQRSMDFTSKVPEEVLEDKVDEMTELSKKKQKKETWKRNNEERIRKSKQKAENGGHLSDCLGTSPALNKCGTDTGKGGDKFKKGQNNNTFGGFPTEGKPNDAVFKQCEGQSSLGETKTEVSSNCQTKAGGPSENIPESKQRQTKPNKSKPADPASIAAGLNKGKAEEKSDNHKTFSSSDKSTKERDKEGGVKRTNKLKEEVSETPLMSGQPQTQSTTKTQTDNAASSLSNNPSLKQNSSPSKTYKNEENERRGRNDGSKKHPNEMPKSLQDIKEKQVQPPAKEDVTVVFVAVLAKEFQFNERRQKVVILQKSAGEWVNMATMTVLEKCVFFLDCYNVNALLHFITNIIT